MFWIFALFGVIGYLIYTKVYTPSRYWKKRGVPSKKNLTGNLNLLLKKKSFAQIMTEVYNNFPDARYVGMYQFLEPILVVRDPELIKKITIKDFDYFTDHRTFIEDDAEPLWTRNLLSLTGDKWKDMRSALSPTFTSSKMKMMHKLVLDCSNRYTDYLRNEGEHIYEMKDVLTRFANDVIATTAFGLETDSWKNKNNEFYLMGREATNTTGFWKSLNFLMMLMMPKLSQMLGLRMFTKKASDFFTNIVGQTIKLREEKGIVRHDMIHLLMEMNKTSKQKLTLEDLTAQAFIFFFAGFESISTVMSFLCYELAVNPDIQEKLLEEIEEGLKKTNGEVTYDAIMNMKYLDMVVQEVLRKWPIGPMTDRKCVKDYPIQAEKPSEKPIIVEKGMSVWLPLFPIQRDEKYWPDPEKFDPERFSDENKDNNNPYTFLAFGLGPRNCIGNRFPLMEAKTMIVCMLQKLELQVCKKTPIPMKINKNSMIITADPGFYIKIKPRNKK